MYKRISLDYLLEHHNSDIQHPELARELVEKKNNLANSISVPQGKVARFIRLAPLIEARGYLGEMLSQQKERLSETEKERIRTLKRKYDQSEINPRIPDTSIVNERDMGCLTSFVKKMQQVNGDDCPPLQRIRRDNLVCDIGIGGSSYVITYKEDGRIGAYAKIVSFSNGRGYDLSFDSVECGKAEVQSLKDWKKAGLTPHLYGALGGAFHLTRLMEADRLYLRAPEAGEMAAQMGLPQKKTHRYDLEKDKIGVKLSRDSNLKSTYRELGTKCRYVSGSRLNGFDRETLNSEIALMGSVRNPTEVLSQYLDLSRLILANR